MYKEARLGLGLGSRLVGKDKDNDKSRDEDNDKKIDVPCIQVNADTTMGKDESDHLRPVG